MKNSKARTGKKLFVIKKFVMAGSVSQALKLEKRTAVDAVWIDEDWSKGNAQELAAAIGYANPN